ncbi:uncharacterized protein LOC141587364 [Silene latifolia]|uniref:uncharacterized protein LOC141587364 n=1 Tax=Silene latifolia TaxID=37657 RepID=UPI003D77FD47
MGGHGGLNILPQKRWNVYNFDNREKVRKDEEQAAKDEQLKREQSRKHDSAIRIEQLRRVRGIDPVAPPSPPPPPSQLPQVPVVAESSSVTTGIDSVTELKSESKSKHINLFEGIRIFDPVMVDEKKRKRNAEEEIDRRKKMRKELRERKEEVREVGPEDEVYRLGYGVAGKGVKAPWYTVKNRAVEDEDEDEDDVVVEKKEKKKKTVAELREERLKREKVEKERQLALLSRNGGGARGGGSYGRYSMDRERKQWRTGDRF